MLLPSLSPLQTHKLPALILPPTPPHSDPKGAFPADLAPPTLCGPTAVESCAFPTAGDCSPVLPSLGAARSHCSPHLCCHVPLLALANPVQPPLRHPLAHTHHACSHSCTLTQYTHAHTHMYTPTPLSEAAPLSSPVVSLKKSQGSWMARWWDRARSAPVPSPLPHGPHRGPGRLLLTGMVWLPCRAWMAAWASV